MLDIKIKIDAKQVLDLLEKADSAKLKEKMANAVADEVVLPALHKYPTQSGKKMQFKSAKQRAFVIAAIKRGDIQVPYRRSGDYGRSFEKSPIADGLVLRSNLAYAPYVRGEPQASYHKGNWTTLDELTTLLEADAALAATAAIVEELT